MAHVEDQLTLASTPCSPSGTGYRVMMIAPTSFFADYGCHVRILEEARALQAKGCTVTICTYHTGQDIPDVNILRTVAIPWRRDLEVGSSWHKVVYDSLLFLRTFAVMFRFKPQVIHAHLHEGALIGLVLSWLWRVPLVFDFQGSLVNEMLDHKFIKRESIAYHFLSRLERFIDHKSGTVITSSDNAANLLINDYGCSPRQISCVPDCVNTEAFTRRTDAEELSKLKHMWGVPSGRIVVVYLGLLADYQGIPELLQAARIILEKRHDVHFVIAGYPHIQHFSSQANAMGIHDFTTFPGRIPYRDAPKLLAIGDIAVMPKQSKTEGAGKLLNYMSMALPTVAFDTPVSHEYLDKYGRYAVFGDSASLAAELEVLLDKPDLREELGEALRQRAIDHFSWARAGDLVYNTYQALLNRHKVS